MLSIVWCLLTPVSHIELEVVVTLRGEIKQKTANSLRISGLFLWCHRHCRYLYSCVVSKYIHSI